MVEKGEAPCYTDRSKYAGKWRNKWNMNEKRGILPRGWQKRIFIMTAAALAGNFLMAVFPWPEQMLEQYQEAVSRMPGGGMRFLFMTLFLAPAAEEAFFRLGIYGFLRRFAGFWPSAVFSALAFAVYHGNWIQGVYAFLSGIVLAWGYESSEYRKYLMAAVMHGVANLAALAVFG